MSDWPFTWLRRGIPFQATGASANVTDCDAILSHAKLFSPYSDLTWYITEMDAETGQCFGLVGGFERELGYFDLIKLAETTVFGGVPAVERDLYWRPRSIGEIKSGSLEDSPHGEETRRDEAMTDEIITKTICPDAPDTHGSPLDDAGYDAVVEVAEEQDAGGEAEQEPQGLDDGGKQADFRRS